MGLVFLLIAIGQVDTIMLVKHPVGKSPGRAVLLSLVIPGGGQIYTQRYWKAGIIAPAEVGLGYLTYQEHQRAKRAWAQADTMSFRYYSDRRTSLLWWTAATIVFSMADAYVSAQMFGFDQELQIDLRSDRLGLRLAWR